MLAVIINVVDKVTDIKIRQKFEMPDIPLVDKEYIVETLKTVILYLSRRIQTIRLTLVGNSNL